ncbi:MAG: hypothetical protein QNK37_08305 [Acidobacteriota bacterium]|nr:hypothetical protein [Acidobacteriota bacterium]
MKLAVITNDLHRVAWARYVLERAQKDTQDGIHRITDELQADLSATTDTFQSALDLSNTLYHDLGDQIEAKNEAANRLQLMVTHFWTALENRAVREELPAKLVGGFYTNTASNRIPVKGQLLWIQAAKKIRAAHDRLTEAGLAPMANPSIEELDAALAGTSEARQLADELENRLAVNQEILERGRRRIDQLYREIYAYLRIILGTKRDAIQRRIIRTYGYEYVIKTGSGSDDGGTTTPVGGEEPAGGEEPGGNPAGEEPGGGSTGDPTSDPADPTDPTDPVDTTDPADPGGTGDPVVPLIRAEIVSDQPVRRRIEEMAA